MQVAARWRTAALIAAALFAGSIIGPPLVQAATAGLVTIQGANSTNQAQVNASGQLSVNPNLAKTNASQLLVAEADPANDVVIRGFGNCTAGFYTVPSGKALIITGVTYFLDADTVGTRAEMDVFIGPAATPCVNLIAAGISSDARVAQSQNFQPGIPVPAGDAIGANNFNNTFGAAALYGYLVPAAAVPASIAHAYPKASSLAGLHR